MASLCIRKIRNIKDIFNNKKIHDILIAGLKYRPYFKLGLLSQLNVDSYVKEAIHSYVGGNSYFYIISQDNGLLGLVVLKRLDWDSRILRLNLASIELFFNNIPRRIKTTILSRVVKEALSKNIDYLTVRVGKEDKSTIGVLKLNDFQQDEQLYFMYLKLDNFMQFSETNYIIREFAKKDIKRIKNIAYSSYNNRFTFDKRLPQKYVKILFANWAYNCCNRRSNKVFVIEKKGYVVGFIAYNDLYRTKQIFNRRIGLIDLFIIDKRFRGKGLGKQLLSSSLMQVKSSYDIVGLNVADYHSAAIKIYEEAGFKSRGSLFTFHRWP